MVSDILIGDELWDTEPPSIPKPSRLFHLEPIGLNTGYVESLTSYVARLAEAHSVPLGTLLGIEVKPMLKDIRDENPLNSHSIVTLYGQASVRALNGTQTGARQLVQVSLYLCGETLAPDFVYNVAVGWGLIRNYPLNSRTCFQNRLNDSGRFG